MSSVLTLDSGTMSRVSSQDSCQESLCCWPAFSRLCVAMRASAFQNVEYLLKIMYFHSASTHIQKRDLLAYSGGNGEHDESALKLGHGNPGKIKSAHLPMPTAGFF